MAPKGGEMLGATSKVFMETGTYGRDFVAVPDPVTTDWKVHSQALPLVNHLLNFRSTNSAEF